MLLLLAASFLPGEVKVQLHMRGPFHAWGHVYAFAMVLLAFGPTLYRAGRRWLAAGGMVFLAFGIEFCQARQSWAAVEWADLLCDAVGTLAAVLILGLGAARAAEISLFAPADPPVA